MFTPETKRPAIPEILDQNNQGVVAVFSYQGQLFGTPLLKEDELKVEFVIDPTKLSEDPTHYGQLKKSAIGLVGGKIEDIDRDPSEALRREIIDELSEHLDVSTDYVKQEILPFLKWEEPKSIKNFQVIQATQRDKQKEAFLRGAFIIYLTKIELTFDLYEKLKTILVPLTKETEHKMRPFVANLFAKGELE